MTAPGYSARHVQSSLSPEVLASVKGSKVAFIETGSHLGHGVEVALQCGFDFIYSVDESISFYEHCKKRFYGNKKVFVFCGDSPVFLRTHLNLFTDQSVIYLDAHSEARNPLLEELSAIVDAVSVGHTILIDDVRMFGSLDWHGLAQSMVTTMLDEHGYAITYADTPNGPNDLLVAQIL